MTTPRYTDGWIPEEEHRRLGLAPGVHYRSIMRMTDGRVWTAPLGTPDPWPATEDGIWLSVEAEDQS